MAFPNEAMIMKTLKTDRISQLPDHILTRILSFLPTKYAVRTATLSNRWKYLFTAVPNLDFDDSSPPRRKREVLTPERDGIGGGCTVNNLNSLVEAHIFLEITEEQITDGPLFAQYVTEFTSNVSNVKLLHLADESLAALDYSCCSLPTFHNLIRLELGVVLKGRKILFDLLDSSPNLEVLAFLAGFMDHNLAEMAKIPYCLPEFVPVCLSQHLKKIEIWGFEGKEYEMELVEYFLKNGEVLVNMTIKLKKCLCPEWRSRNRNKRLSRTRNKLLMFQRRSLTCQIVVS